MSNVVLFWIAVVAVICDGVFLFVGITAKVIDGLNEDNEVLETIGVILSIVAVFALITGIVCTATFVLGVTKLLLGV